MNYLQHHPLTIRWLKCHPNICLKPWTCGIHLESYEEKQYVTINLEQHPLEVLKLGTYVGSCLGVGGLCTDSAAAVMLDVNKQVLYARDAKGVVLARQLLAISKNEQLVAFEIQTMFRLILKPYFMNMIKILPIYLGLNFLIANLKIMAMKLNVFWRNTGGMMERFLNFQLGHSSYSVIIMNAYN